MGYELEKTEYKGFTIRIVQDESPEEPDWGGDEVFIQRASERTRYQMGRIESLEPAYYLDWGEGHWRQWAEVLKAAGVDEPPADWEHSDDWERHDCWCNYEDWRENHSREYTVWPLRGGNVHGPGSFQLRVIHSGENYDLADFWVFVRDGRTDTEKLADAGSPEQKKSPEGLRDTCIEQYEQWANGDVWGYIIEDSDGDETDSCWNYYGSDYCLQAAKEAVDGLEGETRTHAFAALYDDLSWKRVRLITPLHIGNDSSVDWAKKNVNLGEGLLSLVHSTRMSR